MKTKLLLLLIFRANILLGNYSDSTKIVDALFQRGIELDNINQDEALINTQRGVDIAYKINYREGLGEGYNLKANILLDLGDFEAAEVNYLNSLKIRKKLNDVCDLGESYKALAYFYNQEMAQAKALTFVDSAITILTENCKNVSLLGRAYTVKGIILSDLDRVEEAINILLNARKILKTTDLKGYIVANDNLGYIYFNNEQYHLAKGLYLTNYEIYKSENNLTALARIANPLGAIFYELGDYATSETYLKEGIQYAKQVKSNLLLFDVLSSYVYWAIDTDNLDKASEIISELELLIASSGGVEEQLEVAKQSVELYNELELFKEKALFQDKVIVLKDSLNKINQNELLARELAKLDIAKKEAESQAQKLYIACLLLGLLTLGLGFLWFRNKAKKEKLQLQDKLSKEEASQRQKIIDTSFKVKQEIHKKLHDQVSNPLSTAAIYMESYEDDTTKLEDLEIANKIVNDAYETSRKIAHELLPFKVDWVDRISLNLGAIKRSKNINSTIKFDRKKINNHTFSSDTGTEVAAIIGNLLVNVEKHSEAEEVIVEIKKDNGNVYIKVEDNGKGFDTNATTGIGLNSIQSNVAALKGKLKLHSIIGQGTKAEVFIPVT